MKTLADLLDLARARSGITTDSALGVRLGKSRQTMSQWRSGLRNPEDDDVVKLCRIAGVEPAEWLLIAQISRTKGAAHDAWLALARKLGAAASVTLMLCAVALPSPAKQRLDSTNGDYECGRSYTLCEVVSQLRGALESLLKVGSVAVLEWLAARAKDAGHGQTPLLA